MIRNISALELVEDARAAEVTKMWERIDTLRGVQGGWLGSSSLAPSATAAASARASLARLIVNHTNIPRPRVFPRPDGGIQAEWVFGTWAVEVVFDAHDGSVSAEATNAETHQDIEITFTRDDAGVYNATGLASWLESLMND